ncbi:MAG: hypothetical protein IPN34_16590 [Planctomycetes bacterium]|nr:hypothetical protein [Planctomycetota bacterium]
MSTRSEWIAVTEQEPCTICHKGDWCSRLADGTLAKCMRQPGGKAKLDKNGTPYWIYRQAGADVRPAPDGDDARPAVRDLEPEPAPPAERDKVYRTLLSPLPLSPEHREHLRNRGLSDEAIQAYGFRSFRNEHRLSVAKWLLTRFPKSVLAIVPGFATARKGERTTHYFNGVAGILIPVLNAEGLIVALLSRPNVIKEGRKYLWVSAAKNGGVGSGSPLHYARGSVDTGRIRLVEGPLKAIVAASLSGMTTAGCGGSGLFAAAITELAPGLAKEPLTTETASLTTPLTTPSSAVDGSPVLADQGVQPPLTTLTPHLAILVLAFDADIWANKHVGPHALAAIRKARALGVLFEIETWPAEGCKGIDDALAAGKPTTRLTGAEVDDFERRLRRLVEGPNLEERIAQFAILPSDSWPAIRLRLLGERILQDIAADVASCDHYVGRLKARLGKLTSARDLQAAVRAARDEARERAEAEQSADGGDQSLVKKLIAIGMKAELFATPSHEAFAALELNGHRETHRLSSTEFNRWIRHRAWKELGEAPGTATVETAILALEAQALFEGARRELHLRVCRTDDGLWYDLADSEWRAVHITPAGWNIVERPPILFRRYAKTQAQHAPIRGGSLELLRRHLGIRDERSWRLVVVWLLAAFIPGSPRCGLILTGEQGTAKSSRTRMLRRALDPCFTELLPVPENVLELAQSAMHGWLLAFDNLSKLSIGISDALSRIITGDGNEKRKLFTDEEDVLWAYRRIVVLNGIGSFATRPDLLERSIKIELEPFSDGQRIPEEVVFQRFAADLPQILGAVFDALVKVLAILPSVDAPDGIRMMDFAKIGVAVEKSLGWPNGEFVVAMRGDADSKVEDAVEDSVVAQALIRLGEESESKGWRGTSTELLTLLKKTMEAEESTHSKSWPKSAAGLSSELKRIAPVLRRLGITIDANRGGHAGTRDKVIRWCTVSPESSSALSASSASRSDSHPSSYTAITSVPTGSNEPGRSSRADDADNPRADADDFGSAEDIHSSSGLAPTNSLSNTDVQLLEELFRDADAAAATGEES